jgi:hypothetical protein
MARPSRRVVPCIPASPILPTDPSRLQNLTVRKPGERRGE